MLYILSPSPRGPHERERAYQRENEVSFLSSTPKRQSPAYPHGSSSQRRQTDRARGGSQEVPGRPDGDSAAHWQGRSEVSLTSPYCNLPRISTISTAKPSRSAAAPRDPTPGQIAAALQVSHNSLSTSGEGGGAPGPAAAGWDPAFAPVKRRAKFAMPGAAGTRLRVSGLRSWAFLPSAPSGVKFPLPQRRISIAPHLGAPGPENEGSFRGAAPTPRRRAQ